MSDVKQQLTNAVQAARKMGNITNEVSNKLLNLIADNLIAAKDEILAANAIDLEKMPADDPRYDRLKLTTERIESIAGDVKNVGSLPMPTGKILEERTLDNGLNIKKITVPLSTTTFDDRRANAVTSTVTLGRAS